MAPPSLVSLGKILSTEIAAATNGSLVLPVVNSISAVNPVVVISLALDPVATGEQSTLTVDETKVTITGSNYDAIAGATTTLLQAIEFSSDADLIPATASCVTPPAWRVPVMTVTDSPEVPLTFVFVSVCLDVNYDN